LLKEAQRKAEAKEPPLTFLGRKGLDMPREISFHLDKLVKPQDDKVLAKWLDQAVGLLNGTLTSSDINVVDKDEHYAFTCMFMIFSTCIKNKVTLERVEADLLKLGFEKDFVTLFKKRLHEGRSSIEVTSQQNRVSNPRLKSLNWRIDIIISSADRKKLVTPSVTLRMFLSNGEIKHLEMSLESFQKVRYNVAKVLHQMGELENHPMMRIMSVLEAEESRKL